VSTIGRYRTLLGYFTLVGALAVALLLVLELSMIPIFGHISRAWFHAHPWFRQHSDDKSVLRLYVDSWVLAVAILGISFLSNGDRRRKSLIVSAASVIGFPIFFFIALSLG
jgi:hypothetical protein